MIKYKLKVIDIIEEAKDTKTYLLEKPEELIWEEGAHTHIGLIGFDEGDKPNKSLVRHMSIMTLPNEEGIGFTTRLPKNTSEFKEKLKELKVGEEVVLFKVACRMQLRHCNRPLIFLSMGVGIATIRPLIYQFLKNSQDIPYIMNINVDSSKEFIYKNELDRLVKDNYKNYWMDSRAVFYETVAQLTEEDKPIYYIVGSDEFLKDMILRLRDKNVEDMDIIVDKREESVKALFEQE